MGRKARETDEARVEKILAEILSDEMGGWMELPLKVDAEELTRIKDAAREIREKSEVLVCIGIGGSYLGHRAVIEAVEPKDGLEIVYAGNSLSRRELTKALSSVEGRDFSVNVISKSGTTLEPAVAFEEFYRLLVERYGEDGAARRVYATTDARHGKLHDEAVERGYTRFVVPDNIGGRYSVFTAVGLLPMAVAGVDIDEVLRGAKTEAEKVKSAMQSHTAEGLVAVQYALGRDLLRRRGYDTEVFATFEPCMAYFNEWLKQLFGESEGKNGQGVWPASVIYTTDLHSLGQFMQEGRRNLWETIVRVPTDERNALAVEAVAAAHEAGGIPVIDMKMITKQDGEEVNIGITEVLMGQYMFIFMVACAVSAKLSGVNPFDQPGVEAYKKELRRLLGEKC